MSCYEWSRGTIVLPSAEVARFKKALQVAMSKRVDAQFAEAQDFWKSLTAKQKADRVEYLDALGKSWENRHSGVQWKLQNIVGYPSQETNPRRLLKTDFTWPNNRTTNFYQDEFGLTFNGREVTYEVAENNHAREHAEATMLHKAFDEAIKKVKWTFNTGGVILGNDEYNKESGYDREGGGGSYVVAAYGYIGAKEAPQYVGEFLNSQGKTVHVETVVKKGQFVGKVVAGRTPMARASYGFASRSMW